MGTGKEALKGAGIGLLAGLAVAIGGAYKDSPIEGFKPLTFLRSPIIGMVEGAVIQPIFKPHLAVTFLGSIGAERITTESYKILRGGIPGKFLANQKMIPQKKCLCSES